MKLTTAIPMCLMLALAGCTAAPDSASTWLAKGGTAGKTSTGTPAATTGSGDAANPDAMLATNTGAANTNKTGGTSVNTAINITTGAGATTALPASSIKGNPLAITRLAGGHYVADDGLLSADIPPGALSKDAVIKIQRNDTSKDKVSVAFVPGINFNVDLGGAMVAPGKAIVVTAKVDDRFVDEMKKRDPAFTPDKYNLKQDAKGIWMMSMTVAGPSANNAIVRPALANVGMHLIENGAMPLPGAVAAVKRYLLAEDVPAAPAPNVSIPSGISSSADCSVWDDTVKVPVPSSIDNWYDQEGKGQFSCNTYDGKGWYMNIYHDLTKQKGTCGSSGSPDPSASEAPLATADVPTHTTWDSDDVTLAGKDAVGADVRFDFPWSPSNGPTDVVADATGLAKSFTLEGLKITATAYTDVGPAHGDAKSETAKSGMNVIELKCPKFSPKIQLNLTCDSALPTTVTLRYTLDGVEATKALTIPANSKDFNLEFYVVVPDDKDHEIKLSGVDAGGDLGITPPGPEAIQAHRNGVYPWPVKLMNIAAH
ncbi:MAG: hypothetical protein JWM80_2421 [Cyanobacteria bacterium RYN_339]|nr:hypothetical protein [Cyanobacteria bacterium RYN_339]